ncbi:MAG: DUF520 family protein [Candidatus Marinimicrobia bacterium]|nr:DUF520 family protein [Candidatus Neomarinimicrobiota bacterium]
MRSFDIVNRIDLREVDNAVNNTLKEVPRRYDFRDTNIQVNLNKRDQKINLIAGSDRQMETLQAVGHAQIAKNHLAAAIGSP